MKFNDLKEEVRILAGFNSIDDFVYIPGHVPSFKNSRIKTKQGAIIPSKAWSTYQKESKPFWSVEQRTFNKLLIERQKPYNIGFYFIRKTLVKFDFHNICAGPLDLMTLYQWILDDNIDEILPIPLKLSDTFHSKSPKLAGVVIYVYQDLSRHLIPSL
jgi:hypothetical protein